MLSGTGNIPERCGTCATTIDVRTCYLCGRITAVNACDHYLPAESLCGGHSLEDINEFLETA